MLLEEKIKFLKENVEPIYDEICGNGYRASVYLKDGTYLPCVRFRNPDHKTNQAIKRLDEERKGKSIFSSTSGHGYKEIVELFVTTGNRISEFDIARIELSPYAFSKEILSQIRGETSMGWTGFCAKMTDGKVFGFGTSFSFDFFQMPDGYTAKDVIEIINHSYYAKDGTIKKHKIGSTMQRADYNAELINLSRPFFDCYLKGL
ncbi:hypothetical protein [Gilvibacter sediminis]|uniref:hypothetical protein n=1 Tax=Gilvibacter sediminis TaxID=379071 RepID=UPI002350E765|nr:hypothetical protein [Gilvibacter sediminis]MDC7998466.1 hypothetical protein [Gilvibacter sediminis]